VLAEAPNDRVLDLGCGQGGHAWHLARRGFEVVAVDASKARLERAAAGDSDVDRGVDRGVDSGVVPGAAPQWVQGEMGAVEALVAGRFGGALMLGNSLAHLLGAESLSRMLIGLRRRLLPGAPVVIQQLNFDRIHARRLRSLPVMPLPLPGGNTAPAGAERLALRLLDPRDDGFVVFTATLLDYAPESDPAVTIAGSYSFHLRGWKRDELDAALALAQFREREFFGGFDESAFEQDGSAELVCVAR
jgi:SAM-dependent methyltransferase